MRHALCSFSRLFGGSTPPFIGRFLPRCDACPSRVVDKIRRNTAVIAWGVASFLAMVLCGWFGILLLRLTGLRGVPAELDIVLRKRRSEKRIRPRKRRLRGKATALLAVRALEAASSEMAARILPATR
jgi:hypothetical protein